MDGRRRDRFADVCLVTAALFSVATLYVARQMRDGLPGLCAGLDTRMTALQAHEQTAIEEFRADLGAARRDAADATKQVGELKEKVARYEGSTGAQEKFRIQTTTRL